MTMRKIAVAVSIAWLLQVAEVLVAGEAHLVVLEEILNRIEAVAEILTVSPLDHGLLIRIRSEYLPDGYNGVMNAVITDDSVMFKKDQDT